MAKPLAAATAAELIPRLALVPGEPAGIGPELCVRLAQSPRTDCQLLAYGDAATLQSAAQSLGLPLRLLGEHETARLPGDLRLHVIPNALPSRFGTPEPANAAAVILALQAAADACLSGTLDGLVTGPVNKAAINAGGIAYIGTTELLAQQAACDVVMMLANDIVRVALVTTHLPLREVADAITPESLAGCLRITHHALQRDFGIAGIGRAELVGLGIGHCTQAQVARQAGAFVFAQQSQGQVKGASRGLQRRGVTESDQPAVGAWALD